MNDGPRPKVFEANHDRFKRSVREESRVAKALGGQRLPRSGGLAWSRHDATTAGGDVKSRELLVEHKRAEPATKSISVKRDWLAKVTAGAKRANRVPALALTFEGAEGFDPDWVAIPLPFALRLLHSLFGAEAEDVVIEDTTPPG